MRQWHAKGKLLLTGEYFVLDGAKALAIPARLGQRLCVEPLTDAPNELHWASLDHEGNTWFEARFDLREGVVIGSTTDVAVAERLLQIFAVIQAQFTTAYAELQGQQVHVQLEFPRLWGLGSSSTLISLLSQWLEVDAYRLLANSFGGSGYDIACARAEGPILYQRQGEDEPPLVTALDWAPGYQDQLFFSYQGHKQNSRDGINYYRELCGAQVTLIDEATSLTEAFLAATTFEEASKAAAEHEDFVGNVLQMEKIQDERFADFPGVVKSLGAWGGDFVLVFSPWPAEKTKAYFNEKGCPDVLAYNEMIA